MNRLKSHLLAAAFAALSLFSSCLDSFNSTPDPNEVVEIPGFDGDGFIQPYDINDANEIVGYHGDAWPLSVADFYQERFAIGFIINSDGSGFRELRKEDHQNNWPFAINTQGQIAGAYMPFGNYLGEYVPTFAYTMDKSGEDFQDLHPEGYFYSQATHITESGIILGEYGPDALESIACLFRGDSIVNLVDPARVKFSRVECANNELAIIQGIADGKPTYFKYAFDSEELTPLTIDEKIADFSNLHDINDDGLAVGFYVDVDQSERSIGLVYDTNTDQHRTFLESKKQQGSTFHDYNFTGINNDGMMVGRSGRDFHGLLQLRSMKMRSDFSEFRDITPPNDGIYSEMVAINNLGLGLGSIGLPRRNNAVYNKIFVIQID